MIIEQMNKVREQIREYVLLQRSASQADSLAATLRALTELRRDLASWVNSYQACQMYLAPEQCAALRRNASRLRSQLGLSRAGFETNYAQQPSLIQAGTSLRNLQNDLKTHWSLYARANLEPLRAQLRPAKQLPGSQTQVAQIETVLRSLDALVDQPPRSAAEATAFHHNLAKVQKMLREITGFTPAQELFLEKVSLGTATLADVTAELLDWCNLTGLALTLKISR